MRRFRSQAERRLMYAVAPQRARIWSKNTPDWLKDSMPERKRPKRPRRPLRRP